MRILLLVVVVGLAGCASLLPGPGVPPPAGTPGIPTSGVEPDNRQMPRDRLGTREACRAGSVPGGWIVVGYTQRGSECPRMESYRGYNGVVLERYADRSPGTYLTVCAGQRTPWGWVERRPPRDVACPGADVPADKPTAKVILRVQ